MKRIDKETVQRILDSADIVEVVSDFVKLRRRGANYIGLCPFHNERTPSFSVSKSKGICKCFSCGKGGSAIGFVMEHESMSYYEALRYLAAKYNIQIKEEEVSAEQQQAESERESMLAVNEWAMHRFEDNLLNTDSGRDIGFSYFRERGINERMIERFHLGYALEERDILYREATAAGYQEQFLISTGLCYRKESNGRITDRFRGRVIYPIQSVSGKVVAFGGRTLRTDKTVAKYVNSPESVIYSKSAQLYGLFQAKKSITQKGRCILVEGYMDVISMSQSGVENVVASSGTSLTQGQARLIHRFADAVTVIYDSDAAGIKASLRGIDILLAEGLDISIVLLPDGDDPDSFAQSHSSEEVEKYIDENSVDFIRFKTTILLKDAADNPTRRAEVITDIVQSVAAIPDEVKRMVYIQECSRLLDMGEDILRRQVALARKRKAEQTATERQREEARKSIRGGETPDPQFTPATPETTGRPADMASSAHHHGRLPALADFERGVLLYVVRYGMTKVCDAIDAEGNTIPMSVIDLVEMEMANDGMEFSDESNRELFDEAASLRDFWPDDYRREELEAASRHKAELEEGRKTIAETAPDLASITREEHMLQERADENYSNAIASFTRNYVERSLTCSSNDKVRVLATSLAFERHRLSKYHTRFTQVPTELDKLPHLLNQAIYAWKSAMLASMSSALCDEIAAASAAGDIEKVMQLMQRKARYIELQKEYAHMLGDRVIGTR